VARRLYLASLALTPIVLVARYALHANGTVLFVLSALALVPLAYLIGEATENVAEHTGSRVGGFLNASFGNAPELIISLFAISDALPAVVLGSITGSVVSCALLVLGAAIAYGGGEGVDRRSLLLQVAVLGGAVALFLVPSIPSWTGDPGNHELYLLTLPVALVLLCVYLVTTAHNLRGPSAPPPAGIGREPWSLRAGIAALVVATLATAAMSHVLVHSLEAFVDRLGLSQFFVAAVIVALVGNATEHGGAVVTARRGNSGLGSEIAVSSATQVAVFVTPVVALLSGLVGKELPLAFRPVEIATMGLAAIAVFLVIFDARARRWEGLALLGGYAACVVAYWVAGDG
jgi:Ca2+:H+ antiporter